jgi:ribosomal protein L6P/L9E
MNTVTRILFSNYSKLFICYTKQARYLLIKKDSMSVNFLLLTPEIKAIYISCGKELTVHHTTNKSNFLNSLLQVKDSCLLLKKKLVLKGLGFKITYSSDIRTLNFKLGYSHLAFLRIPFGVNFVKIGKNYLIVSGYDPSLIGNFVASVQRLRFPDSYKGKGFWKKYEKKTLKLFKKK